MKLKISLLILLILITGLTYIWIQDNKKGVDQIYLLPDDFEGCAIIYYDIKDAPPLKIENNTITYDVPEDGIILTSSPMDFGWVNKNHSGSYQLYAYYVDKNGKKVRELPQENIQFGATGSNDEQDFYYQFFGREGIEERGCPAVAF